MKPKQWLRATVAQIDAMPVRERVALLSAGIALLVGVEFLVVLPMQTHRQNLIDMASAAADEDARQRASAADEHMRQEDELDQRLKAANEALQAMGVNSGLVGTRGESLSFLLSRTLHGSQVEMISLRALDAEEMRLTPRPGPGEGQGETEAIPDAAGTGKPMLLYRHRYLLSLSGEFDDITQAIDTLEEALKPLRIERVRLQGRPDGRVMAAIHWVTIGLDKSWLSL